MAAHCLLYYITDRTQFRGDEMTRRHSLLAKVAEAVNAGIDYIQLREKDLNARELEALAGEALTALRNAAPLRTENSELAFSSTRAPTWHLPQEPTAFICEPAMCQPVMFASY